MNQIKPKEVNVILTCDQNSLQNVIFFKYMNRYINTNILIF